MIHADRLAWFLSLRMDRIPVGDLTPPSILDLLEEFANTSEKDMKLLLKKEYDKKEWPPSIQKEGSRILMELHCPHHTYQKLGEWDGNFHFKNPRRSGCWSVCGKELDPYTKEWGGYHRMEEICEDCMGPIIGEDLTK